MMGSFVSFAGNLSRDPKLTVTKETKTHKAWFSVAVDEGYGDRKKTHFYPVVVYGDIAENLSDSLRKGARVNVSGHLETYKKSVVIDGEEKDIDVMQVIADEIGPDLRWATAKVTKVEREETSSKSKRRDDDDDDDEEEKPRRSSNASSRAKVAKDDDDDDEEEKPRRSSKASKDDDDDF